MARIVSESSSMGTMEIEINHSYTATVSREMLKMAECKEEAFVIHSQTSKNCKYTYKKSLSATPGSWWVWAAYYCDPTSPSGVMGMESLSAEDEEVHARLSKYGFNFNKREGAFSYSSR